MKKKLFFLAILLVTLLSACEKNIYKHQCDIPEGIWDINNVLIFTPQIDSINKLYDINLEVRHATMYPSQNLWLFIKTTAPSGTIQIDTLECTMADNSGKWISDCAGDICDFTTTYKKMIKFVEQGKYTMEIQHGMRTDKLPLILKLGIIITESEPTK